MIIVYVIFVGLEFRGIDNKIAAIAGSKDRYDQIKVLLDRIRSDVNSNIKIKTAMSILTGLLSYGVLALAAIQFAIGNVLEPRLTGQTLNLSPVAIMLSANGEIGGRTQTG